MPRSIPVRHTKTKTGKFTFYLHGQSVADAAKTTGLSRLGRNLRRTWKSAQLTQKQAAPQAPASTQALRNWESRSYEPHSQAVRCPASSIPADPRCLIDRCYREISS